MNVMSFGVSAPFTLVDALPLILRVKDNVLFWNYARVINMIQTIIGNGKLCA
jgi:hypothetical protein